MNIKRLIASFLILITAFSLISCGSKKPHDFRDADFGMSISEVSKKESTDYVYADDDFIFYDASMNGEDAEIYYYFKDGALVSAECKFLINETTIGSNMERFVAMANYITSVYGQPLSDDYRVFLKDDLEDHEGDGDHLLIYHKYLQYFQEWQTETAHISLLLNYKDEQINYIYSAEAILPKQE